MAEDRIHTSTMLRRLSKTSDFNSFIKHYKDAILEIPFSEYISGLCRERRLVPEHIIKSSQIDRTYGHQLFNGARKPSRDKVVQLAFGFGMSVDEAQDMLRIAGKNTLYPKIKRDAAIIFCLSKEMNVIETQSFLESLNLTLLGGDWQHGE